MSLDVGDIYTYPGCEIQIKSIDRGGRVTYLKKSHNLPPTEEFEQIDDLLQFLDMWQFKKAPKGYCIHKYEFVVSFTTLGNRCVHCGKMES